MIEKIIVPVYKPLIIESTFQYSCIQIILVNERSLILTYSHFCYWVTWLKDPVVVVSYTMDKFWWSLHKNPTNSCSSSMPRKVVNKPKLICLPSTLIPLKNKTCYIIRTITDQVLYRIKWLPKDMHTFLLFDTLN